MYVSAAQLLNVSWSSMRIGPRKQSPPICEIANEINDRYDFMPLPDTIMGYTHIGTSPGPTDLNSFSNTSPFARDVGKTTLLEAQLNYERMKNAVNRMYWTGDKRGKYKRVQMEWNISPMLPRPGSDCAYSIRLRST